MAETTKLTEADENVLCAFADQFGRNWKSKLREMWMNSNYRAFDSTSYGDDWATLQRLRNTLGPSWLVRYRLPADYVPPLKFRSVRTGKPVREQRDYQVAVIDFGGTVVSSDGTFEY